jgi:hypothetical protein
MEGENTSPVVNDRAAMAYQIAVVAIATARFDDINQRSAVIATDP